MCEYEIKPTEITEGITKETIERAEKFGKYLAGNDKDTNRLAAHQLRKFYGEVKKQELTGYKESDFIMLKPKLAYAAGKANKENRIHDFYIVMAKAIDLVDDENKFRNFIQIFEAIVAYHKLAEGEKK